MNRIPLGSTVRCIITGLQGCASTETEQINGNVRYDVQPKSEDGKAMPDAWAIDLQSLEVVDAGISGRASAPRKHSIKTGQQVRDRITGHEGIVTDIATYFNGCVFASVVPRKTDKSILGDGAPGGSMLPVERLEVTGAGLTLPAETKPTGGPSQRAARI
jgi:hypothetical protein